ncbi:MAG: hypothetical protein ABI308_12410 [Mucilaginibacter sp.]
MSVYFRVDGNFEIGMGHFVRCVSIAQILKTKYNICFILHNTNEQLISNYLLDKFNYKNTSFNNEWLSLLTKNDIVVLDGYKFTIQDQKEIKATGAKLVLIDDFTHDVSVADAVINHQLYATAADYKSKTNAILCLGANYLMIRNSFIKSKKNKVVPSQCKSVFLCLGGSGLEAETKAIIEKLILINGIEKISLLVGETFEGSKPDILKIDNRIKIYQSLSDLEVIDLINDSDIGIVIASTIAYEALYLNLPLLLFFDTPLQVNFYNSLCKVQNVLGLGLIDDVKDIDFLNQIEVLLDLNAVGKGVFDNFSPNNFIDLFDKLSV